MRTTLDIADDVLHAAKGRARREKKTAGEVLSELARRGLTAPPEPSKSRAQAALYGFRPFAKRCRVVSNDEIDRLRDDDAY